VIRDTVVSAFGLSITVNLNNGRAAFYLNWKSESFHNFALKCAFIVLEVSEITSKIFQIRVIYL